MYFSENNTKAPDLCLAEKHKDINNAWNIQMKDTVLKGSKRKEKYP